MVDAQPTPSSTIGPDASSVGPPVSTKDASTLVDDDTDSDAGACESGQAPGQANPIKLQMEYIAADETPLTTTAGGSPSGRWVVKSGKVYFPESLRGQLSEDSGGTLSGWAIISPKSNVRMNIQGEIKLIAASGQEAPPVNVKYLGRGSATLDEAALTVKWACRSENSTPTDKFEYAIGGNGQAITLMRRLGVYRNQTEKVGELFVVLEGEKLP
jgi:hypothetical protein